MLRINGKLIKVDIEDVIKYIKDNSKYFQHYKIQNDEIHASCPFHKDGQEKHPSFSIHCGNDKAGVYHCFTCGTSGNIISLLSYCLDVSIDTAKEIICKNFENVIAPTSLELPIIDLNTPKNYCTINENVLKQYRYIHPYVLERGLTEETIKKFSLGCTPDGQYITFPCWDKFGNLIGIFKRSTTSKRFLIPSNIEKPIYLLNFVLQENYDRVFVCEGNFDALKMWQNGYPAIALFGAGTSKPQMELLNSTGIRHYILMYDNDDAGRHGAERFKKFIRKDVFITDVIMPKGKDCADCSKDEIDIILKNYGIS